VIAIVLKGFSGSVCVDVLDLARADAEGHRAEGTVRRGVAVAADDGDARHRETQLRADDVHDALLLVAERSAGARRTPRRCGAASRSACGW
jgi:hypothetical protein